MTSDKDNDDSYQELVNESIDELNASEDFEGTSLTKEKKDIRGKTWMSSATFKTLVLLSVLSTGLYVYFRFFLA